MNKKGLHGLISQGEGFHLEFKESINSSLTKEIVAFANAKGGTILLGVDDDGNIKNREFGNDDKSKIQALARDCDPAIDIELEIVSDEKNVLIMRVPAGLNKPYRCVTGFYLREGANSAKRKTIEIKEMFRDADWFSFDDQLCPKAEFGNYFSSSALKRYFAECGKEQILPDVDTLHNLGVLEFIEGKPVLNHTGVLFFTDQPQLFLPQSTIQCVRYKGVEKIDIENQKDLSSDILTNLDEAFSFLRRSLDIKFDFEEGNPKRKEIWEIPSIALREAVINSIAHRDYINRGSHIQIEVFDDRVSITNYGGLVKGLKRSDLGKRSLHRNPNIVNILHRANFIEKLGTGILRINRELRNAELPEAIFEINEHWFSIVFSRKSSNELGSGQLGQNQLGEASALYLNETMVQVIEFCMKEPKSRYDIFRYIDMSNETRNFNRHIQPLIEKGFVNMTEPESPRSKNQKYYTTELGESEFKSLSSH